MSFPTIHAPLVSVIIPCYNHGYYLAEAIESVRTQSYPHKEIIVIDDGSTDNTQSVAQKYEDVTYIYQPNKGLSSARNTGILHSTGDYLVFLDADDLLLPDALLINLQFFNQCKSAGFVSGAYRLIYAPDNKVWEVKREVNEHHYQQLLQGNYIGMHATVMFPRWVFKTLQYDITLKACEDYDLYLRIAKEHPIIHHTHLIAVYRIHTQNMSNNYTMMLKTALTVLKRQRNNSTQKVEADLLLTGKDHFKRYYTEKIYDKLIHYNTLGQANSLNDLYVLWEYNRPLFYKYQKEKAYRLIKKSLLLLQKLAGKARPM
jgi:glycosyltransferase involved in cell wall biosynthesis